MNIVSILILCTQRELSVEEEAEEIEDSLDETSVLILKEIKDTTVTRKIPTAIADSGAFTPCVQPTEEQIQKSECCLYT